MEGQDLMYTGSGIELTLARDPDAIIAEAKKAADKLVLIVSDPKIKAIIQIGESKHLKLEAWQTLGHFYALAGKITKTEEVRIGEVFGFKAYADLVHVPTGKVISSAEAMCLDDEEKWSERPKYAYAYVLKSGKDAQSRDEMRRRGLSVEDPGKNEIIWEENPYKKGKKRPKKERVQIGMEQVPTFQLMSMAETRAMSKVHSLALRWIVVLAGFNPTPAEELRNTEEEEYPESDGDGEGQDHGQTQTTGQSTAGSQTSGGGKPSTDGQKTNKPPDQAGNFVTASQINNLWNTAYEPNDHRSSLTKQQTMAIINASGYENISMIPAADYDRMLARLKAGEMPTQGQGSEA
jgi:hypothetical protein